MIVFSHTKFGLVGIQESEVKWAPRSERVFEIPVRVGLRKSLTIYVFKAATYIEYNMVLTEIAWLKWQTNVSLVSEDCWFAVQFSRRI